MAEKKEEKYAIRFGLGAIKAVGFGVMEKAREEREKNNKFSDVFDFSKRMDAKTINKKSIEALAKSGAFDEISKNRRQIFESFDILSAYSSQQESENNSDQMSFFGALLDERHTNPELKKVVDWTKKERLAREFEAFGFFLNEHPLDDYIPELQRRGVVFSNKIEKDELSDGDLIKMAGVIATSKHRSGPKGRFAYLTISDPCGMFEAMIFDEAIITNSRDLLADGSTVSIDCLIRKDEGGIRTLIRDVRKLEDFIAHTPRKDEPFEDIKKQPPRRNYSKPMGESNGGGGWKNNGSGSNKNYSSNQDKSKSFEAKKPKNDDESNGASAYLEKLASKQIIEKVEIIINERSPVFDIKSFLSTRVAPVNFDKTTRVSISICGNNGNSVVEIAQKYLLDESDLTRLRAINKVIEVKIG